MIDELNVRHEQVQTIRHSVNRGKGAAVQSAVFHAQDLGYSHALQIDADLQHDISDVPLLISLAEKHPESLILAYPIFGSEAPLVRVWGRKLTSIMVAIQTMSFKVRDSLFGFRVYPLSATASLLKENQLSQRMAFDAEIIIRLVQQGLRVINTPSRVTYHKDGVSHFRYLSDNIQMIRMHLSVLRQMPRMLSGWVLKKKDLPWHRQSEIGSLLILKGLFFLGELFGTRFLKAITSLFTASVIVLRPTIKINSKRYLQRALPDRREPTLTDVFCHCECFTHAMINSIWEWLAAALLPDRTVFMATELRKRLYSGKGGVLLSAHFGALEYARARFSADEKLKIKAVMFHGNSRVYRGFLESVNPAAADDVVLVDSFSPATIIQLQTFISSGGYVALLADRLPPTETENRQLACRLFDSPIKLPYGPFLLAHLLRSEILTFFAVKDKDSELKFYWKDITPDWSTHAGVSERLKSLAWSYTHELESVCREHHYHWFNFFNYFEDVAVNK